MLLKKFFMLLSWLKKDAAPCGGKKGMCQIHGRKRISHGTGIHAK